MRNNFYFMTIVLYKLIITTTYSSFTTYVYDILIAYVYDRFCSWELMFITGYAFCGNFIFMTTYKYFYATFILYM